MPKDKLSEMMTMTIEMIVIDYANLSGRESDNRAEFRNRVSNHLRHFAKQLVEELVPEEIYSNQADRGDDIAYGYDSGFNACRQSILDKAKEIGIK